MKIIQIQIATLPFIRPDNAQPETKIQMYGLGADGMLYYFDFAEQNWLKATFS